LRFKTVNKIKQQLKNIISTVLITILLLPIAIQFFHAHQKHKYSEVSSETTIYAHHPKNNCSLFHYQINYNSINFSTEFSINEVDLIIEKIITKESKRESSSFFHKASRAPPTILFLS
jgi:thymidylate synthase